MVELYELISLRGRSQTRRRPLRPALHQSQVQELLLDNLLLDHLLYRRAEAQIMSQCFQQRRDGLLFQRQRNALQKRHLLTLLALLANLTLVHLLFFHPRQSLLRHRTPLLWILLLA